MQVDSDSGGRVGGGAGGPIRERAEEREIESRWGCREALGLLVPVERPAPQVDGDMSFNARLVVSFTCEVLHWSQAFFLRNRPGRSRTRVASLLVMILVNGVGSVKPQFTEEISTEARKTVPFVGTASIQCLGASR